ncbi:MAG: exodeoxyribonuclease VII small subunit [Bacteroidales bacterium]|uniref:exodeoxyribonuclease VII small subunit n=1 Tax=Porphyromonas sp. TaxID=1924944 RepID=UPI00297A418A|nr:exodeoxyribonuclease VII small subunit [Porphyromonas sp.]MDD7438563.1 exodeoxyribonuclease VII small subunit [Bacteroidales bacterium]MDY3066868.1 exodeoxyribonuclease VII small subunit [Porphyromonas sp.]
MTNQENITLSYDEAVAETEALLKELESNQLPIDEVLQKSRRVVALIAHCRKEIKKVGEEVGKILDELKEDNQ